MRNLVRLTVSLLLVCCSSGSEDRPLGTNVCNVDGDLALDLCELSVPLGSNQKVVCEGAPLCGGGFYWTCACLMNGKQVSSCESSAEHACQANCCAFTERATFTEPCDKAEDACVGGYECVTAEPKHADQEEGDFCMLPCTESSECGALASCVCKGAGGSQTSGPVPDGYCECG